MVPFGMKAFRERALPGLQRYFDVLRYRPWFDVWQYVITLVAFVVAVTCLRMFPTPVPILIPVPILSLTRPVQELRHVTRLRILTRLRFVSQRKFASARRRLRRRSNIYILNQPESNTDVTC